MADEWQPMPREPKRGMGEAPYDGKPVLIETDHRAPWGTVHMVIWSEWYTNCFGWAVHDCKHGPYPLRGYNKVKAWRSVPTPSEEPHGKS